MPRFVLLEHDHPERHVDFMLEADGVLLTWRISHFPAKDVAELVTLPAQPLPDHRLQYLTYEGPVSGDRGRVRQLEAGEFEWLQRTEECSQVRLVGRELRAEIELIPIQDGWEFRWQNSMRWRT